MGALSRIAVCVLALAGCDRGAPARVESVADSARNEVSFRLAGANDAAILVEVFLNGEGPFDFVLDTGATLTCIDQGLAERLDLPEASGLAFGAGVGGSGQMRLVRIDSLRVGPTTAHDLLGCALDLQRLQEIPGLAAEGLLGLNVLKSFRVTLDFQRSILRLDAPR